MAHKSKTRSNTAVTRNSSYRQSTLDLFVREKKKMGENVFDIDIDVVLDNDRQAEPCIASGDLSVEY